MESRWFPQRVFITETVNSIYDVMEHSDIPRTNVCMANNCEFRSGTIETESLKGYNLNIF